MGKAGFSWKRLFGITKAKRKVSRKTGIPLTKSGRQRKIGKIVTGGKGCLVTLIMMILIFGSVFTTILYAYTTK
ncbi:MAG: hypothetical protein DHS20C13_20670 [Thermodesulfobacteriota bacterium]|nr:MAG: hypothetical protein DHS20C13_20670 [Thermodesulfobacteriota bacterium]